MVRIDNPRQPELHVARGVVTEIPAFLQRRRLNSIALVTGGRSVRGKEVWSVLTDALLDGGTEFLDFTVRGEPSPSMVNRFRDEIVETLPSCDAVVAIGGGSVIDAAKALAALLGMERELRVSGASAQTVGGIERYLEGVGDASPTGATLPLIVVPTTAGTGSEATKNAVLSHVATDGYKKSLRHDNFIPAVALIDPDLHIGAPDLVTRASGLDAITQLIEVYVSTKSNPLTAALAAEGLRRGGEALPHLLVGNDTAENRAAMALAAYISGVGLAAVGLGVVHGAASPIGARREIPHGVVCGLLLGPSIDVTCRRGDAAVRRRYAEASRLLGIAGERDEDEAATTKLVEAIQQWAAPLPGFSSYGFGAEELEAFAGVTGLKNHPVSLREEEIATMLRSAFAIGGGASV